MTRNEAIAKIIDALDALNLLPAAEPAAAATHHQVSPELFSPPHPTTNSQNDLANQQHFSGVQNPDRSWQRLAAEYPPDHPAPGDLGSVPL
jgi:hypothetical protein